MCYHYFGKVGYWLTYWSILITLWGSAMGIMVIMTDYLTVLPIFSSISPNPRIARILPTLILVIICWLLCLLKDSKYILSFSHIFSLLVGVSALGLFALLFAVIVALVYLCLTSVIIDTVEFIGGSVGIRLFSMLSH